MPGCICGFVPPHIYNNIILKGTATQRSRALDSLNITHSLHTARVGLTENQQQTHRLQGQAPLPRSPLWALAAGPQKQRTIYSANHTTRLPGNQVRAEGEPPIEDPAVNEAYDYMGVTFDFYWNVFSRNSMDDHGLPLHGSVHYSQNYDNAFWDGQRMIYGDGDGQQFQRFTRSVDVIGHELTHGVTQYSAGLIYWGETGALNESISDVFGSLVKQYAGQQRVDQADWLIGASLFIPGAVLGKAIRSMAQPGTAYGYPVPDPVLGKDPQPAHMKDYQHTIQDNGGVHINSGIPNRAFYVAATQIGGNAWERAGAIWYHTLTSPKLHAMRYSVNFQNFAQLTLQMAQQLFPSANAPEPQAVRAGWAAVGINV